MGPIVDRSTENLVGTDKGIVMARRRLMRAAKALLNSGTQPPGVDPAHQRVRSAAVVLPPDMSFADGVARCAGRARRRGARIDLTVAISFAPVARGKTMARAVERGATRLPF